MSEKKVDSTVWLSPLVERNGPKVEFRGDHIHIQIGADLKIDSASADEYWQRLRTLCDKYHTCRVLVEGVSPKGEFESREVVDAGLRAASVPNLWLAYSLDDFERTQQSELYEVIAAARGVRVKFFSDREAALRWLRSNAPA